MAVGAIVTPGRGSSVQNPPLILRGCSLAGESLNLLAVTLIDVAGVSLRQEEGHWFHVNRLRPGARQRDRGIQVESAEIALRGPCGLSTALVDCAFLTRQSRVPAEAIQLVFADQVDRAGGIHTFEHGAHWTEHEIASLMDQDQGRVEISCADKLENLGEGLSDLLDHALDVIALNGAHLVKSQKRPRIGIRGART